MKQFPRAQYKDIPHTPGVYHFYDQVGDLLYIGKANDLNNRVRSYFAKTVERGPLIQDMISHIHRISVLPTDSEIEALLLEARLIRELQPPANSRLKDAKSFLVLVLFDEQFPRLQFARQRDLETIRAGKLWGSKIKQTYGPFLQPGEVRSAMKVIRKILPYRDCTPAKYERYHKLGRPCLYGFLNLCPAPCVGHVSQAEYLKRIHQLDRFLNGKKAIVRRELEKQMDRAKKHQEYELCARLRDQIKGFDHLQEVSLLDHERPSGDQPTLRMEAFDISLLSGTNAVGSMVVFSNDHPARSEYRRFRIRGESHQGDLKMMAEVLKRRLDRTVSGPEDKRWPAPDLWLIDGGLEHLKVAERVVAETNLNLPIVAIAKGRERKRADAYYSDQGRIRRLTGAFDFEKLTRALRDEAHRFAITYHRSLRSRQAFASMFDNIPGIGPATKRAALIHFGTAVAVRRATEGELAEVISQAKARRLYGYLHSDLADS